MGNINSFAIFTEDLLDEYTTLTYLSRSEILHLYKIFDTLGLDKLENLHRRFDVNLIEEVFPQLKYNPFKDRIFRVFSSEKDNCFSFEDMLDLCSVMSNRCPAKVKAIWAFRIMDFDEDGTVGTNDLSEIIDRLTNWDSSGDVIEEEKKKHIIKILMDEMDLESQGSIGQLEFQHAIGKMSEFTQAFCFRL